jgi:hypothetical protein
MSLLQSGKVFSNGEQITAGKLNAIIGDATISTTGVDGSTIIVNANDALAVRSGGISTSQLQNYNPNATGDTGVTEAKIAPDSVVTSKIKDANVTFQKLSDVIDDDTMTSATDTNIATSESIKAYVDQLFVDAQLKPNIVQAVKSDTFEELNPQNAWFDIPDLSVSITPRYSNSKILVQAMVSSSTSSGAYGVLFKLVRDTTDIALGDTDGNRTRCSFAGGYSGGSAAPSNSIDYLDSPSLTAGTPVVYKVQCSNETTVNIYINRSFTNSDANEMPRPISTLTVTEIFQ